MRRLMAVLALGCVVSLFGGATAAAQSSAGQVAKLRAALPGVIERARTWLFMQQRADGSLCDNEDDNALAALALLESGLEVKDERFQRLMNYLATRGTRRVVFIARRAELLARALPRMSATARRNAEAILKKDLAALSGAQQDDGIWRWDAGQQWPNMDATYDAYEAAVLLAAEGYKLPEGCLKRTVGTLVQFQHDNGGWGMATQPDPGGGTDTGMTVRALTCVAQIGEDPCGKRDAAAKTSDKLRKCADRGLLHSVDCYRNWAGGEGGKDWYFYRQGYFLGRLVHSLPMDFIGEADLGRDWYQRLLPRQANEGKWRTDRPDDVNLEVISTAFVLYQFAQVAKPALICEMAEDVKAATLANRSLWNAVEVLSLRAPVAMCYERARLGLDYDRYAGVPLIYLTLGSGFKLADKEKESLKRYVAAGGTVLAQLESSDRDLLTAAKTELEPLWPPAKLDPLLKNHPVWTSWETIGARPTILGLDDGLRTFAFLLQTNLACDLATGNGAAQRPAFQVFTNIVAYALEGQLDPTAPIDVAEAGAATAIEIGENKIVAIGLLQPADGTAAAELPQNTWPKAAELIPAKTNFRLLGPKAIACTDENLRLCDIAYLPSGAATNFTGLEVAGLRDYIDGGGLLLLEARLGNEALDRSARRLATDLGAKIEPARGSPILTGQFEGAKGFNVEKTHPRKDGKLSEAETDLKLLVRDGKVVGVYSPLDLVVSASGIRCWGLKGYAPSDARRIMANLLIWRTAAAK